MKYIKEIEDLVAFTKSNQLIFKKVNQYIKEGYVVIDVAGGYTGGESNVQISTRITLRKEDSILTVSIVDVNFDRQHIIGSHIFDETNKISIELINYDVFHKVIKLVEDRYVVTEQQPFNGLFVITHRPDFHSNNTKYQRVFCIESEEQIINELKGEGYIK